MAGQSHWLDSDWARLQPGSLVALGEVEPQAVPSQQAGLQAGLCEQVDLLLRSAVGFRHWLCFLSHRASNCILPWGGVGNCAL